MLGESTASTSPAQGKGIAAAKLAVDVAAIESAVSSNWNVPVGACRIQGAHARSVASAAAR